MRLFQLLVRMLSTQDYHDFAALYALAHPRQNGEEGNDQYASSIATLFAECPQQADNKQLLAELAAGDASPNVVARHERDAFGTLLKESAVEMIAVARKLTAMMEMNETFVADTRLWRWIENVMEDIAALP